MAKKTISIPDDLLSEMRDHPTINWSSIAGAAFRERLDRIERPANYMDVKYAHEKLSASLSSLQGRGTIQERLQWAFVDNVMHVPLAAVPEDKRQMFEAMQEALSCERALAMDTDTALQHAADIGYLAFLVGTKWNDLNGPPW